MKQHIPNILTIGRLVLTLVMFAALVLMAAAMRDPAGMPAVRILSLIAVASFAVAAISDFFDGMLARRWGVVSVTGAILDPIADKILVCGAILGLLGLELLHGLLIPSALILFREFAVSALREVLAPRGLKLPVTFLAKTKTTLQLAALGVYLALIAWAAQAPPGESLFSGLLTGALALYWLAAAVTVWTGVEYGLAARKALKGPSA